MNQETLLSKYSINPNHLKELVLVSKSLREVIIALKWNESGGSYKRIRKMINLFNLDISHFTGSKWNKGKVIFNTSIYLSNQKYLSSSLLKLRLIKEGMKKHCCEICNCSVWNKLPIPIELHHIDGNRYNNNLSNLQVLCCNCHAQTNTWRNKHVNSAQSGT